MLSDALSVVKMEARTIEKVRSLPLSLQRQRGLLLMALAAFLRTIGLIIFPVVHEEVVYRPDVFSSLGTFLGSFLVLHGVFLFMGWIGKRFYGSALSQSDYWSLSTHGLLLGFLLMIPFLLPVFAISLGIFQGYLLFRVAKMSPETAAFLSLLGLLFGAFLIIFLQELGFALFY